MKHSHQFYRNKFWTAPELLRSDQELYQFFTNPSNPIFLDADADPVCGTPKADIYAFAIILHEILVRAGTWGTDLDYRDPEVIIGDIISCNARPAVDDKCVEPALLSILTRCWADDVEERMEFSVIRSELRKINKETGNGNILDNLLSRMERYANNLETLVEERTEDYLEEKRKCEDLLYELLPKSVASKLIQGEHVVAETFQSVTIYFSDIVGRRYLIRIMSSNPNSTGFTALSSSSTPLQVVDMLNDLYTLFDSIIPTYDVYKVNPCIVLPMHQILLAFSTIMLGGHHCLPCT